jgi:hypothetical protein
VAFLDLAQDLRLALAPVHEIGAHEGLGIGDGGPMGRPVNLVVPVEQLFQRIEIVAHIAVGRAHHAGRPAHDMVAREERFFFPQSETHMVRGMAGREDRVECPAIPFDGVAVFEFYVGLKFPVRAFLARAVVFLLPAMGAEGEGRCAGQLFKRLGGGRMVHMRMGDEDMGNGFPFDRRQQCFDVIVHQRAGVDHRYLALADNIGARAFEGEAARIIGGHPADQRRYLVAAAIFDIDVAHKRDLAAHSGLPSSTGAQHS